jgi:hypothetical protein
MVLEMHRKLDTVLVRVSENEWNILRQLENFDGFHLSSTTFLADKPSQASQNLPHIPKPTNSFLKLTARNSLPKEGSRVPSYFFIPSLQIEAPKLSSSPDKNQRDPLSKCWT